MTTHDDFANEAQFHLAFERWMKENGILFVTTRMDKPSTHQNAEPDYFVIDAGKVLAIELKMPKTGKLSTAQVFRHAEYAKARTPVHVLRTLADCIEMVRAWQSMLNVTPERPKPDAGLRRWGAAIFAPDGQGSMRMVRKSTDADLNIPLLGTR